MIKHRNKQALADKETWMQENRLNKFPTIVSEVLFFVGNPVSKVYTLKLQKINFLKIWVCSKILFPVSAKIFFDFLYPKIQRIKENKMNETLF